MGVKDLWLILAPVCEKKSLWELRDSTVAIDLSVWICENQFFDQHNNNFYLRNLFFRTSFMLLLGMKPIFVLEGNAPELKYKTLEYRRNLETKSKNCSESQIRQERGQRLRIKSFQKQCEELLESMGVCCICSEGEAEALCAVLNRKEIVDGVVSKDSDCFLYGARTVYRNFNISCNGGTYDLYNMNDIERKLNLDRHKMVALSLICGCDYNMNGIGGVGKEIALKFLATVNDGSSILDRMSKWCEGTNSESLSKEEKKIKEKALQTPEFPFKEIQNEFLNFDYDVSHISYEWKRPNLQNFIFLTERKLGWKKEYAIEKFLPILSRWHLLHDDDNILSLDFILKKRNLRSVQSYEVKWKNFDVTTVEPRTILKKRYNLEIESFENSKLKKKGTTKIKKKENTELNEIKDLLNNLGTEQDVAKKIPDDSKLEKKGTKKKKNNNVRLDEINHDFLNLSIEIDVPKKVPKLDLYNETITESDFECSPEDLLELSAIVESIVSKKS